MFTIYNLRTKRVHRTITRRTAEIAYAVAEKIAVRMGEEWVFDDTCEHGTAYAICRPCDGWQAA